ncbi:hypothetical protein J5J10_09145 [Ciceribacter sp. L1K23]|uniref:hypothetical protein n=1 Tax=Ciceribacter sp. L1K23 TaxID=2820276 RepID=UPI001B81F2EB|nr:hypothetical protein [Ciceribacter sp. L1K23]MBR0555844.1 hypothetical protein [Ciceribacter sp. L1K23]
MNEKPVETNKSSEHPSGAAMPTPPSGNLTEKVSSAALVCAMVGGLGPFLVPIVTKYNQQNAFESIRSFIRMLMQAEFPDKVASILSFGLPWIGAAASAGFLAYLWRENNNYRAFVFGMGAPALFISLVLTAGGQGDKAVPTSIKTTFQESGGFGPHIFSQAVAQEAIPNESPSGATLSFDISNLPSNCESCAITFFDGHGKPIESQPLTIRGPVAGETPLITENFVPTGADTAIISGVEATNRAEFNVDEALKALNAPSTGNEAAEMPAISLSRQGNWLNGLRIGVGASDVQPYNLQMTLQPEGSY